MRTSAKTCLKCGPQPVEHFGKNARYKDGLHPYCKDCRSEQSAEYYESLTDEQKRERSRKSAVLKATRHEFVLDYLLSHPCIECGESDPVVLEFDHVRGYKKECIAEMITRHATIEQIEAEIAKCDVVGANCHRKRTASRSNHYRFLRAVA